jgi:uncharacterized RDD family membrane protein YckC
MSAPRSLFWKRVGAYLLDVAALFLVLAPVGWLVQRAAGFAPSTGPEIWRTLLLNFSLPTWTYFSLADSSRSGATLGKHAFSLRAARIDGGRIGLPRAILRTALKLLPWELAHVAAFALSTDLAEFGVAQAAGLVVANALMLAYVACAARTRGRSSLHDLVAGTVVSLADRTG